MRITTSQLFSGAMRNINATREKYLALQESLITQKRINRPSDDPIGATRASSVRTILGRYDQYLRNVNSSRSFVTTMEIALTHVIEDLTRAREIAVDINSGIAGPSSFDAAAQEVRSLFQDVLKNATIKDNRRFVFAGYRTNVEPFDNAGNYLGGVNQDINIEISENNFMTINKDGNEVFKSPIDVFQVLRDLETAIASGDSTQISNMMPQIESALDHVINQRADIGPLTLRLETAESDNYELNEAYTRILSDTEDVDIAKATSDFAFQEQVYQATLLVSSRILNTSLLDFIR